MNRSMLLSSGTMGQLQKKMDTVGHNIANINTNGFKSRETQFSNLLVQQINNLTTEENNVGRLTPDGIRVGNGAGVSQTNVNLEQGSINQTGRALDLAISNRDQFFQVATFNDEGEQEISYTRDGGFYLQPDAENLDLLNLVTKDGDFVIGSNGNIQVPADYQEITISEQGDINVKLRNGVNTNLGRLELVQVQRPQFLESVGENRFALPDLEQLAVDEADVLAQVPVNETSMQQGALEQSNVDLSSEMVQLMQTQRSYQFNARAFSIGNQTMGLINNIR